MERVAGALEHWIQHNRPRPPSFVDTRGIGKTVCFGAADEKVLEKTRPVWQRKLQNYLLNVFSDFKESMEWALKQTESISVADMDSADVDHSALEDGVEDFQDQVLQLYSVLMQVNSSANAWKHGGNWLAGGIR